MKKPGLFLLMFLISLSALAAQDVIVLSNGTIFTAEVLSYDAKTTLTVQLPDKVVKEYRSSEVLAIRTGLAINSLITQTFSPAWEQITYTKGTRANGYYIPSRFTWRGERYSMETQWGMESQVFEFFQTLEAEKPKLDDETKALIAELKARMIRQNQLVTGGLLSEAAGLILTLVPFFVMEDSVDPVVIPDWALWVGVGGITLNVAGLGMMASQLFVDYESYLPRIAESYNRHLF
ncbi:hypothetical protein SpiGrapes_1673 [Sphaerochaeta pleomorpha str. Grapes]|uniref:PEGA domain-containing protein n=1 Tax=Sphaerochaeta pleomorpha (strain ATCC BAA-1885 / DSM 22778 / Grapes) TaxID=158190 RepID=G8QWX2_SPHPG|nr:hypothetical protein [Sphaerochaeta pleomorpha]AEV29476.1 hypothetical protein SpiGrapes_1673 [Sphaerochaeta pleomorpha str. Grapes]